MDNPLRKRHHRRSIRLPGHDYSRAASYFLTICKHHAECLFGAIENGEMTLSAYGGVVRDEWARLPETSRGIELGPAMIMPNHFHGVVIFTTEVGAIHESPLRMSMLDRRRMGLSRIVGRFKMVSAKRINEIRNTPGRTVWQRNYYEHIIRNDADYERVAEYPETNPGHWESDTLNPMAVGGDRLTSGAGAS